MKGPGLHATFARRVGFHASTELPRTNHGSALIDVVVISVKSSLPAALLASGLRSKAFANKISASLEEPYPDGLGKE